MVGFPLSLSTTLCIYLKISYSFFLNRSNISKLILWKSVQVDLSGALLTEPVSSLSMSLGGFKRMKDKFLLTNF